MKKLTPLTLLSLLTVALLSISASSAADPLPLNVPPAPEAGDGNGESSFPSFAVPESLPEGNVPNSVETGEAPAENSGQSQQANEIQQLLKQGDIEQAIQMASQGIANDPSNADTYKALRAEAYWYLGRYAEALADQQPMIAVVTSENAELKSGKVVLQTVPAGTQLAISGIKGNWLKVAAVSDQPLDWAWIHVRNIQDQRGPSAAASTQVRPLEDPGVDSNVQTQPTPPMAIPEDQYDRAIPTPDGGYYYHARPIHPLDYYRYPSRDYGREYYDYWRHVPPRYWRYLP